MAKKFIDSMVDRFLGWKLPEDFDPDCGITFKRTYNDHLPVPMKHAPIGTNLLNAIQAKAMLEHLLADIPPTVLAALDAGHGDALGASIMAASFYKSAWLGKPPEYLPSRVRVLRETFGDPPFRGAGVAPGDYDCESNRHGAVSVRDRAGDMLGLLPKEFEVLEFRASAQEETK